MRPAIAIAAAFTALSGAGAFAAAPCTTPTTTCALTLPPTKTAEPPRALQQASSGTPSAKQQATSGTPTKRDELLSLFKRTASCMHRVAQARVRLGDRDELSIGHTITSPCGQDLYDWLLRSGEPQAEAAELVSSMSLEAVRIALAAGPMPPTTAEEHAEPLPRFGDIQKQNAFRKVYAEAQACMREASVAGTQFSSGRAVARFSAHACGGGLRAWLHWQEKSITDAQINAWLLAMAYQSLDAALRGPDSLSVR
jgi:hypothetical protein